MPSQRLKQVSTPKKITFALPFSMGKEIAEEARRKRQTTGRFMAELYRQYKSRKVLREVSKIGATIKKQGLKPEDFGVLSEDI